MTLACAIAGPSAVIGAELDMHCHLNKAMVEAADVIVAFKEFPQTDFLDGAEDLVDLCIRTACAEVRSTPTVLDCRAIAAFMASREPGRSGFVDRIKALKGRDGILSITIAPGFMAADVYDLRTKVLVCADGDRARAVALAERLAREILNWGAGGDPRHLKPEKAIAEAPSVEGQPAVGPTVA
jgi:microcystin degradation protein MlrC